MLQGSGGEGTGRSADRSERVTQWRPSQSRAYAGEGRIDVLGVDLREHHLHARAVDSSKPREGQACRYSRTDTRARTHDSHTRADVLIVQDLLSLSNP